MLLDHDETTVDSTTSIHYPAHVETMRLLRPDCEPVTLDSWYNMNFHPGIMGFYKDILKLSPVELEEEFRIWRSYTEKIIPEFFDGIFDSLEEYKKKGGIIIINSHSQKDIIEKHFKHYNKEHLVDHIFGWDHDENKRKPNKWIVDETQRLYNVSLDEILVIDDLKPGFDMAKSAGVEFAWSAWAHNIPEIRKFMEQNADHVLEKVDDFKELILKEAP
ncbi:MAG: HAD family hydrolase [Candidatus Woesearchaeota archaeon]